MTASSFFFWLSIKREGPLGREGHFWQVNMDVAFIVNVQRALSDRPPLWLSFYDSFLSFFLSVAMATGVASTHSPLSFPPVRIVVRFFFFFFYFFSLSFYSID